MRYKGHNYEIVYCDPNLDFGRARGMFRIIIAMPQFYYNYHATFEQADEAAKKCIDKFVESVPQTKQEWLDAIRGCMVWSSHEECDTDDDMVWDLLVKAKTHLKTEDQNNK